MASSRNGPVCGMVVLAGLVIASLLATSCAADDAVTDLETRCQNVQCPISCPSDSFLQGQSDIGYEYDEPDSSERVKRAIAMNNHAHRPIKITPSAMHFPYPNIVQDQPYLHNLQKRDIVQPADLFEASKTDLTKHELQELCCPKCICLPCPEQSSCPPDTKPIVETNELAGQPGSCCPPIHCQAEPVMCFSKRNRAWYPDNATWSESPCTACRCAAGEPRCEISLCKPLNCEHQKYLPNVCCPVCDPAKSIFCEEHNCAIRCRHGYERRADGCALCRCLRMPVISVLPSALSTAKTIDVLMPNLTSNTVAGSDETATQDGQESNSDVGVFSDLQKLFLVAFVFVVAILFVAIIYRRVTIESVKKWLKLLFRCNQLPKRKSAYNRVSSTVPPAVPTPTVTQGNTSLA